ncbi:ankyrin repeat domain-containing protein [Chryseobacterium gambrini]|uniref:ankyrin repeat domain-containing protein n=1 Tax=Chryseobacterium gambrini TaxID=373672 RepID=UPI001A5D4F8B|nr:ankyrin repeat domain-containing protein [Chryseobacterium gambrini]
MDLVKELVLASEAGNETAVAELLNNGANPDAMGPNSGALHCAAFNGHLSVVKMLLEKGANPNVADHQSFYPLHLAASKKHLSIVKELIAHGADLNVVTSSLGTVLHIAAAINFYEILTVGEIKKMSFEARDHEKKTALNVAASFGNYSFGYHIINLGADVNTIDQSGNSPLLNVLYQLERTKIQSWSSEGSNSGVHVKYQITNGCFRYIKPYKGGVNELGRVLSMVDQLEISGYSWGPEGLADYVNCVLLIQYLIKKGAEVNIKNHKGTTPMIFACSVGEAEVITALAKKGASFDDRTDEGITTLHYLARSKRLDGLKAFYKYNENPQTDVVDNKGWTPAHYLADLGGHPDMAKLLIKNGVDLFRCSTKEFVALKKGITAREVAEHWNDHEMVKLLTPKKKK